LGWWEIKKPETAGTDLTFFPYLYKKVNVMAEVDIYQIVWKRYLPVIMMKVKEAIRKNEPVSVQLYKPEFQYVGKKKNVVYEFELEMKNGRAANNLRISAIAKDLSETLRQNPFMRDLMDRAHYKFVLNSDFMLKIEVIPFVSAVWSM
jgi:hypothetical protein